MNSIANSPPDAAPLFGPEMLADPYPLYDRLREADPVHWSEPFNAWIVTRYDEVAAGLNDLRLSSDRVRMFRETANNPELDPFFDFLSRRMLLTDPPTHTRLRGLVNRAFTSHAVESMRPHIQQLVDGFIDARLAAGRMDMVHDLAFPLPATVICEMLGINPDDVDQLKSWSDDFVAYISNHPAKVTQEQYRRGLKSMEHMVAYFRGALPGIRAADKACLLKTMELAHDQGDKLSEAELLANANLLLIAGHETTTNLIGNGVLALLRQPDQWQLLAADPSLIPGAVEEFLRFVGPVQFTNRVALEDVQLGGKSIHRGDLVFLFLAAANRDPAHFTDPNRLDVKRSTHKHLAFGLGHHFCVGAPLARLEAQIAFTTILKRLPNLRLAGGSLEYRENFNLRGLNSLLVEW